MTGSSGNFKSPGYPGNYPNDIQCKWTITVPPRSYLVLAFRTFDTERWWVERNLKYVGYVMIMSCYKSDIVGIHKFDFHYHIAKRTVIESEQYDNKNLLHIPYHQSQNGKAQAG